MWDAKQHEIEVALKKAEADAKDSKAAAGVTKDLKQRLDLLASSGKGDGVAYQWSYYASIFSSAAKLGNIRFGGYLVPRAASGWPPGSGGITSDHRICL